MKKLLLSVCVFAGFAASAQTTVFSASAVTGGFENMMLMNLDTDTLNWTVADFTGVGTSFDAQGEVLLSESWTQDNGALTPDNWVITPAMDLSTFNAVTLTFGRSSVDPAYPAENYSVYAFNATDSASFIAGMASPALLTETIVTGDEWVVKTVDLSALAGQTSVYVAFRHHACTDMFVLVIDDINVTGTMPPAFINENTLGARVYPNPAMDEIKFELNEQAVSFEVTTLEGKNVISQAVDAAAGSINISSLESGVYVYTITTSKGAKATSTFIKK